MKKSSIKKIKKTGVVAMTMTLMTSSILPAVPTVMAVSEEMDNTNPSSTDLQASGVDTPISALGQNLTSETPLLSINNGDASNEKVGARKNDPPVLDYFPITSLIVPINAERTIIESVGWHHLTNDEWNADDHTGVLEFGGQRFWGDNFTQGNIPQGHKTNWQYVWNARYHDGNFSDVSPGLYNGTFYIAEVFNTTIRSKDSANLEIEVYDPGFQVTQNDDSIDFEWNASLLGEHYQVKRNGTVLYTGTDTNFTDDNLGSGEQTYEVYVWNGGSNNYTLIGSYSYTAPDRTPPEVFVTPGAGISFVKRYVDIIINDKDSGPNGFKYVVTDSSTKPTTGWSEHITSNRYEVTLPTHGVHYIHVEGYDKDGNSTYHCEGPFIVDLIKPTLSVSHPTDNWQQNKTTVTVDAFDDFGIQHIKWIKTKENQNNQSEVRWNGTELTGNTVELTENGTYLFYVRGTNDDETFVEYEVNNINQQPKLEGAPSNVIIPVADADKAQLLTTWSHADDEDNVHASLEIDQKTYSSQESYKGVKPTGSSETFTFQLSDLTPNVYKANLTLSDEREGFSSSTSLDVELYDANLQVKQDYNDIQLTWNTSSLGSEYQVKKNGEVIYAGTDSSFKDTVLSSGSYTYELSVWNGESYVLAEQITKQLKVNTKPVFDKSASTLILPAENVSESKINVTFTNVDKDDVVSVVLSVGNQAFPSVNHSSGIVTGESMDFKFNLSTLLPGTYQGTLILKDSYGHSSEPKPVVIEIYTPNLQIVTVNNKAKITWNPSTVGDGYQLTRDGEVIYEGTDTSYTDTVEPGRNHKYELFVSDGETFQSIADKDQFEVEDNDSSIENIQPPITDKVPSTGNKPSANTNTNNSSTPLVQLETSVVELKAVSRLSSITLTWDSSTLGKSYQLKKNGEVIYTGTNTSFTDLSILGDQHTYELYVWNGSRYILLDNFTKVAGSLSTQLPTDITFASSKGKPSVEKTEYLEVKDLSDLPTAYSVNVSVSEFVSSNGVTLAPSLVWKEVKKVSLNGKTIKEFDDIHLSTTPVELVSNEETIKDSHTRLELPHSGLELTLPQSGKTKNETDTMTATMYWEIRLAL